MRLRGIYRRTRILWRLVETSRRKVDGFTISTQFLTFSGFWIYLKSYLRVFSRRLKMWKEGIMMKGEKPASYLRGRIKRGGNNYGVSR